MPTNSSIYIIPPLLSLAACLILAGLSIWKGRMKSENILFSLVCILIALLCSTFLWNYFLDNEAMIIRINLISHFFFVYSPAVFLLFFHQFIGVKKPRINAAGLAVCFILSLTTFTDCYASGLLKYDWGYSLQGGIGMRAFSVFSSAVLFYIVYSLLENLKHETNSIYILKKRYILFSFIAAAVLSFGNIPATEGAAFYPIGNFVFIPLAIMARGVLKYRLMNIKSLFLLLLFRVGAFSLIIVPNVVLFLLLRPWFQTIDSWARFIVFVLLFTINYFYITRIQPKLNRLVYKSKHHMKKVEEKFIENILSLKNLDDLIAEFGNVLDETLSIKNFHLYIKDKNKDVFVSADGRRLEIQPEVKKWMIRSNRLIQKNIIETHPRYSDVKDALARCFERVEAHHAIPMVRNDELVALVFLPEKTDFQEIDADEARFIDNIARPLAVAVSNSIMYQNISDLKDSLEERTIDLTGEVDSRIRAEKEKRESEEKYRIITENVSDAIWMLDISTLTFTYASPSLERITGWTPEELQTISVEETLTPRSWELSANALAEELAREEKKDADPKRARVLELEQVKKDGSITPVEVTVSFIRDDAGNITGVIGVGREIKERKQLEARLRTAKKMEAIGSLAGGVAHDLNNILSGVINYPELLLLDLPAESPLRKPIETIQKSGEKAATIVQDLLTLARRGVASRDVLNINQVIIDYLKSPEYMRLRSFHPGVVVERRLNDALYNISGSKVHLLKTVMNLVSNAAEAMPDGGVILISTDNLPRETLYDENPAGEKTDQVMLRISDTGTGISPEDLERIFEPFYTKKKMGRSGTGLGMSVVWGTIQEHDGYIEVMSEEGEGTTFLIRFPAVKEDIRSKKDAPPMEGYMGKGETILIVDDVEEQREIASGMLTKLGYSTTSVSSGEEAEAYMKTNSADLVLLDMIMDRGIDGLETYKRILRQHPGQKAIIASGYSETRQVRETLEAGAGAYIKKPYLLEKIGMAVRAELDRRERKASDLK
ncbi:MAG: PAS domain S-box protein [Desulfobacterales bacterium]|nr:PAS domain S-box protein [Desulfobacterales bacterium]